MTGARSRAGRRKGGLVVALVAVALLVGGCDYLRSLTGTPIAPVPSQPAIADPTIEPNQPTIEPDQSPSLAPIDPQVSFDPNDPGFSFDPDATDAPPKAIFKHGSATLTIGKDVIKLDRLVGTGFLADQFGGQASWTNGDGWYAQAFGLDSAGSEFGADAFVSFDHIVGGQHWTIGDPSACVITVTRADETGLAGSAKCQGLRWADLMAAYASPSGPVMSFASPWSDSADAPGRSRVPS